MTEINFTGVRRSDGTTPASLLADASPVRGQFFGQSSFSKLSIVAENSVVKCDGSIPRNRLAAMAPMGCGYMTGAGTVLNVFNPSDEDSMLILGLGGVGFAALMAAKAVGLRKIVAVDLVEEKLAVARTLGATDIVNTTQVEPNCSLSQAIKLIVPNGVDFAIDTTGVTHVIEQCIKSLGHSGTLALVGVPKPGGTVAFDPLDLLLACKRVIGVVEADSDPAVVSLVLPFNASETNEMLSKIIPRLVQMYQEGNFPIENISKIYPAAAINKAIADMSSKAVSSMHFHC